MIDNDKNLVTTLFTTGERQVDGKTVFFCRENSSGCEWTITRKYFFELRRRGWERVRSDWTSR